MANAIAVKRLLPYKSCELLTSISGGNLGKRLSSNGVSSRHHLRVGH